MSWALPSAFWMLMMVGIEGMLDNNTQVKEKEQNHAQYGKSCTRCGGIVVKSGVVGTVGEPKLWPGRRSQKNTGGSGSSSYYGLVGPTSYSVPVPVTKYFQKMS